ncbi:MAG: SagB/ThcOx family dehydrogenase [Spartobacteria bacterium]|nr:SagB/ThcOx family dehydrogenase [Spartobacteria bacterium]
MCIVMSAGLGGDMYGQSVPETDVEVVDAVRLPTPMKAGRMSVEEAVAHRRSVRAFRAEPLNEMQLGQLLWAAQGITDTEFRRRAAPSAGATYPLETYLVTDKAIYHYSPLQHALSVVREGDFREALGKAALGQGCVTFAPALIVFAAVEERTTERYGRKGKRYIDMEAGHAAENIHLQAVALGLGSVPVGAFDTVEVDKILRLPREQESLYIVPVGYPR